MGFLDGLGKFLSGKPVFDEHPDDTPRDDTAQLKHELHQDESSEKSPFIDQHGNKITPQVTFRHLKSHVDGSNVTTWAWVANMSQFEIELVRTEVLGHRQDINRVLRANEQHEVKIYHGPIITSDHDRHARLYVKIHKNDDLFLEEYMIEYHRESNGTYLLEEFHRVNPAPRDI
jgi:hypothetical protein